MGGPTKEAVVTRKAKRTGAVAAALAALALVPVLAGCGSSSPSAPPSTIYPQSSATGTLPAAKAYLNSAQTILGQVATTVGALPGAVQGMNTKPDATWTAAATQLRSIATQLGQEASALAALQPPSALKPVQDAVVKGIQTAQTGVTKLATTLTSKSQAAATRKAQVQAKANQLKAQIDGLAQQLKGALGI
jgi:hypothetical protein